MTVICHLSFRPSILPMSICETWKEKKIWVRLIQILVGVLTLKNKFHGRHASLSIYTDQYLVSLVLKPNLRINPDYHKKNVCPCAAVGVDKRRSPHFHAASLYCFQVLHVIDDVLVPLVALSHTENNDLYNPDAYTFLTHAGSLDIGGHRVRLVTRPFFLYNIVYE